jgi:hypothetical protein
MGNQWLCNETINFLVEVSQQESEKVVWDRSLGQGRMRDVTFNGAFHLGNYSQDEYQVFAEPMHVAHTLRLDMVCERHMFCRAHFDLLQPIRRISPDSPRRQRIGPTWIEWRVSGFCEEWKNGVSDGSED